MGTAKLLLGILGGSIAGKWVAAAYVVVRGGAFAKRTLWVGLLSWFLIDSFVSARHGAWFNIWMINIVPLVLTGALISLWQAPTRAPETRSLNSVDRLFVLALVILASTGLLFAFWMEGPPLYL
ncbi:MAG: hypothetical protein KC492_26815, partial [Myxococcales bacterium]|nr:hypothetical protein [Myxococcales bacterium]